MSAAREILRRLSALGARIECRGERVVLCAGRRPVPTELIKAARQAKAELSKVLTGAEDAQQREVEHLRRAGAEKSRISAALVEDAQLNAFGERLQAKPSKMLSEDAHMSALGKPEAFRGSQPISSSKMLTSLCLSTFGEGEPLRQAWSEAEEERAAIIEHDAGIPRTWAEGFARLDPDRPPGDVPVNRWLRFIDDIGGFLDSPFCAVAATRGWGPYDLFGCDRDRPFARIDRAGLLWLLNGDRLLALTENSAAIVTRTGTRQIYRRKPNENGRVLAWELAP